MATYTSRTVGQLEYSAQHHGRSVNVRPDRAPANPVLCDFGFQVELRPGTRLATIAALRLTDLREWLDTPAYLRPKGRRRADHTEDEARHAIAVLSRIVSMSGGAAAKVDARAQAHATLVASRKVVA